MVCCQVLCTYVHTADTQEEHVHITMYTSTDMVELVSTCTLFRGATLFTFFVDEIVL